MNSLSFILVGGGMYMAYLSGDLFSHMVRMKAPIYAFVLPLFGGFMAVGLAWLGYILTY